MFTSTFLETARRLGEDLLRFTDDGECDAPKSLIEVVDNYMIASIKEEVDYAIYRKDTHDLARHMDQLVRIIEDR